MCIKAIANFDYEAAKDNLVETVKYLDAGKILGVAGKLLEINPKDVAQKIKDKVTDEDTRLFVQSKGSPRRRYPELAHQHDLQLHLI